MTNQGDCGSSHGSFLSANNSSSMLTIKARCGGEVRRIAILNKDITYDELCIMMVRLFKDRLSAGDNICLKYIDHGKASFVSGHFIS